MNNVNRVELVWFLCVNNANQRLLWIILIEMEKMMTEERLLIITQLSFSSAHQQQNHAQFIEYI